MRVLVMTARISNFGRRLARGMAGAVGVAGRRERGAQRSAPERACRDGDEQRQRQQAHNEQSGPKQMHSLRFGVLEEACQCDATATLNAT